MRIVTLDPLTEALAYDEYGLVVIPQRPHHKRPLILWQDHIHRSTPFGSSTIYNWWSEKYPKAGVMAVLGPASRLIAVDVDGEQAYYTLRDRLGKIPKTAMVKSGNPDPFRFHCLFALPHGLETTAKIVPWDDGLEFRGRGGLITLPPSIHTSSNHYQWYEGLSFWDAGLAELPFKICEEFRLHRESKNPGRSSNARRGPAIRGLSSSIPLTTRERFEICHLAGISEATRLFLLGNFSTGPNWNQRLFNAACDLNGCGYPEPRATVYLLRGAQAWDDQEHNHALATIRSAYSEQRSPAKKSRRR